jgi:hypothetical protein
MRRSAGAAPTPTPLSAPVDSVTSCPPQPAGGSVLMGGFAGPDRWARGHPGMGTATTAHTTGSCPSGPRHDLHSVLTRRPSWLLLGCYSVSSGLLTRELVWK